MPQPEKDIGDDDLRDDDEESGTTGGNDFTWVLAIVGIFAGWMVVLSTIGMGTSLLSSTPPSGTASSCTEACWGFVKLECPTNRYMSACFNVWPTCGGTPHTCGTDP